MAQLIVFPRPISRRLLADTRDGRIGGASSPGLTGAIVELLDSEQLWHAKVGELLRRLDDLGRFIDSLDDSETKAALHQSRAALSRALALTGVGLKLQFQILSGLNATPVDAAIAAAEQAPATRGSAVATWLKTRIWPF